MCFEEFFFIYVRNVRAWMLRAGEQCPSMHGTRARAYVGVDSTATLFFAGLDEVYVFNGSKCDDLT
jgi:hypothetical protein